MSNSDKSNPVCKIVVDAMGGDFAPRNAILGAIDAVKEDNSIRLLLVGRTDEIKCILSEINADTAYYKIIDAPDVIDMNENPVVALKSKPNSSIAVSAKLIADGNADAFISAGNTGAVVAASTLLIGRIKGVERPTIGTFIPNQKGICTLFDVGAFVDSKPQHLLSYAVMANIYVKEIYGIHSPTIGLLSVGEESEKGNKLTKDTNELLKKSNLNFVGNVEGRDILKGTTNIVICDGFIGNILLKFGESVPGLMKHLLTQHAKKSLLEKIKIGLFKKTLKEALRPLDYQGYGGVPLLGVKGVTIIGHGSSTPLAIKNMVLRAKEMHDKELVNKIAFSLNQSQGKITESKDE